MKRSAIPYSPLLLPILFFAGVITAGAVVLHGAGGNLSAPLTWTDSFFTATSATCVTGLSVVDIGTHFSRFSQAVVLILIQIGGLGIMTFTSLAVFLWRKQVSLLDRVAVGQMLLHDPSFDLGRFLIRLIVWTFATEMAGAGLLFLRDPEGFGLYSAVFHAISAFCNAGFSLFPDSLVRWRGDWSINLIFIGLIVLGGIGFSLLIELQDGVGSLFRSPSQKTRFSLSWYAKIVLSTSLVLILSGWLGIYLAEFVGYHRMLAADDALLSALFQSVTCRTAGFNTLAVADMTNVSLILMLMLMLVGGAPGSCAGGIKVTTFRVLIAVIISQFRGKKQIVIGKFAIADDLEKRALLLFVFAIVIIFGATLLLDLTEGGDKPHVLLRGQFIEIMFEAVSAFGTVGLSTGLTPKLTSVGRWIVICLMFIGRLGPLVFISALQTMQRKDYYTYPQERIMIG